MLEANPIIKRHSRLGITSTIIGAGLPILLTVLTLININLPDRYIGRADLLGSLKYFFEGFWSGVAVIALPLHLVGLIFALVGIFSTNTKKGFPAAGIILNLIFGLIGLGIILLLLLFFKYACCAWR